MWTHAGPDTFPNGCMIAEIEVDPETGVVKIDRVCSVDDRWRGDQPAYARWAIARFPRGALVALPRPAVANWWISN